MTLFADCAHLCSTDINECLNPALNDCGANTNCINDPPGSFTCTCQDGYGPEPNTNNDCGGY